jgi:hypothetical protein
MTGIKVTIPRESGRVEVDITEVRPEEWPHLVVLETRYGRSGWDVARKLAEWVRANAARENTEGPPPSDR